MFLLIANRFQEALSVAKNAIELNPQSSNLYPVPINLSGCGTGIIETA